MSKIELRRDALKSRRSISEDEVGSLSLRIKARLLKLSEYLSCETMSTYVAKSDEVQTAGIIESALADGKRVLVPRSEPASSKLIFAEIHSMSELVPGHFGVLEPPPSARVVSLDEAETVLVPVVAWDGAGHRIGYGKGYFDRALGHSTKPVRVGLALEFQKYDKIPNSSNDVGLDVVVTEERVVRFERRPL